MILIIGLPNSFVIRGIVNLTYDRQRGLRCSCRRRHKRVGIQLVDERSMNEVVTVKSKKVLITFLESRSKMWYVFNSSNRSTSVYRFQCDNFPVLN